MFTVEERDRIRDRLLAKADADAAVVGVALTGSHAVGAGDRWSDTDLVLAVRGELTATLNRWTQWIYDEFGAQHHWDLPAGASIIRVFLLPGWLEIDMTFASEAEFGPRGPQWQTVFGQTQPLEPFTAPDRNTLVGLLWHHALHARICIQRSRWWQAEHWISAMRDHVITLACLRLGHPTAYAKGAHLLPDELVAPLETTLVRSLAEPEIHRALSATVTVVMDELERSDPALATRLRPMLIELSAEVSECPTPGTKPPQDPGRPRPSLPHLTTALPADPHLAVRLTTGRARLTDAADEHGTAVARFTAAGTETDFAPPAAPLLRHLLDHDGWVLLGDLAHAAGLSIQDTATVVGELVTAQAATTRAAGAVR